MVVCTCAHKSRYGYIWMWRPAVHTAVLLSHSSPYFLLEYLFFTCVCVCVCTEAYIYT